MHRSRCCVRHCTEALVYSNHPRAAAASSYLAIIFRRIASGVPCFLRSHRSQCSTRISAGADVGHGMNGVTQRELSFLLLLWGLSDPRIAELRKMPRCFSIKLHSKTQVSVPLGMFGGRSPRYAQNPLSGERRKTLSITLHALSPSHHHLYIIHLIN